jgi:hypothetical protein
MGSPFIVPVVLFIMIGLTAILRGPLGHALADRLRHSGGADPALKEELDSLRLEVDELRQQLGEAQERMDFAERLLARRDEPARLEGHRE